MEFPLFIDAWIVGGRWRSPWSANGGADVFFGSAPRVCSSKSGARNLLLRPTLVTSCCAQPNLLGSASSPARELEEGPRMASSNPGEDAPDLFHMMVSQ